MARTRDTGTDWELVLANGHLSWSWIFGWCLTIINYCVLTYMVCMYVVVLAMYAVS